MIKYVQSKVRNVSVNSIPEKTPKKKKCRLRKCFNMSSLSCTVATGAGAADASEDFAGDAAAEFGVPCVFSLAAVYAFVPLVSGRATIKNKVSKTKRTSVMMAGTAYTFISMPE